MGHTDNIITGKAKKGHVRQVQCKTLGCKYFLILVKSVYKSVFKRLCSVFYILVEKFNDKPLVFIVCV